MAFEYNVLRQQRIQLEPSLFLRRFFEIVTLTYLCSRSSYLQPGWGALQLLFLVPDIARGIHVPSPCCSQNVFVSKGTLGIHHRRANVYKTISHA